MQTFHEFVGVSLAEPAMDRWHRYLVVDTAATRPLSLPRACGLSIDGIDLLTGRPCVWRDSASPVLVSLPSASATPGTLIKAVETLVKWRYANCFIYLESLNPPDTLVRMLQDRTAALLPQNLPVLLRYFDTRVFTVLAQTLRREQLLTFLAIASRWAFPDRSGNLQLLQNDHSLEQDTLQSPITFDTAQEAALIDAGEADAMIDLLLNQSNPMLMTMLPPAQFERIRDALANARTLGIRDFTDQVAYCSLDLELGPGFVKEPPWFKGMLAFKAGQLTFSQLVGEAAARDGS